MDNDPKKSDEKVWTAYSLAMTLGYMIVIPVVVFGGGSVLLDKHFDSFPIFTLIGFVLAMSVALLTVYIKSKDIIINAKLVKKDNLNKK